MTKYSLKWIYSNFQAKPTPCSLSLARTFLKELLSIGKEPRTKSIPWPESNSATITITDGEPRPIINRLGFFPPFILENDYFKMNDDKTEENAFRVFDFS